VSFTVLDESPDIDDHLTNLVELLALHGTVLQALVGVRRNVNVGRGRRGIIRDVDDDDGLTT